MTRGEQIGATTGVRVVDRPDGVDDVTCRQVTRTGGHGITGREAVWQARAPQRPALLEQGRTGRLMQGTVDTSPAEEAAVRRVDDGIDALNGEVTAHGLDPHGYQRLEVMSMMRVRTSNR